MRTLCPRLGLSLVTAERRDSNPRWIGSAHNGFETATRSLLEGGLSCPRSGGRKPNASGSANNAHSRRRDGPPVLTGNQHRSTSNARSSIGPWSPSAAHDDLLSRIPRATCVGVAEPAKRRPAEGVTIRHASGCGASDAGRCRCRPAYQAQVFSPRDRRTVRKSFKSLADARAWRADTKAALQKGTMRPDPHDPRRRETSESGGGRLSGDSGHRGSQTRRFFQESRRGAHGGRRQRTAVADVVERVLAGEHGDSGFPPGLLGQNVKLGMRRKVLGLRPVGIAVAALVAIVALVLLVSTSARRARGPTRSALVCRSAGDSRSECYRPEVSTARGPGQTH